MRPHSLSDRPVKCVSEGQETPPSARSDSGIRPDGSGSRAPQQIGWNGRHLGVERTAVRQPWNLAGSFAGAVEEPVHHHFGDAAHHALTDSSDGATNLGVAVDLYRG